MDPNASPARPVALVTGASSGIGFHLARLLAEHGHDIVLVARGSERLAQAARDVAREFRVQTTAVAEDLAFHEAPTHLVRELTALGLTIDVLVNNAGYAMRGLFASLDLDEQLAMIQVNVTSLTALTGLLLPGMIERGRGRILNVASTAAFQAGPLMAVYYATKAYVLSFSEALVNETAGSGVTVTALCPGPTATGFEKRAGMSGTRLFSGGVMDAQAVARQGFDGMMQGRALVIPGWRNRLFAQLVRVAPRAMAAQMARSFQETP